MGKVLSHIVFTLLFLSLSVEKLNAQDIFRSVCRGNIERVDSLLQMQSIDVLDNRGRSLLHWAVACKRNNSFDYLIERNIVTYHEDNQESTPLHMAVRYENEHAFDILINLETYSLWEFKIGPVLLETAILIKSPPFVKKLIDEGVDINIPNTRGSIPVEIAERINSQEIFDYLVSAGADTNAIRRLRLVGEYMGQDAPELASTLFAPNFISTEESEFGSIFNAKGTEFYFGVDNFGKNEIRLSKLIDGVWTKPEVILSHPTYGYNDPFLSNDEQQLYFISNHALDGIGERKDIDIWYVEKTVEDVWSEPINVGSEINTSNNEYYISFTDQGIMYFSSNGHNPDKQDYDIYFSTVINGEFQTPKALPDEINTDEYEADVFISPDESYIIFTSVRAEGYGQGDLYISFKDSNDNWSESVNMGDSVNSEYYEYCPFVTKDGKFLFFTSNQDIYWVSTDFILELKTQLDEN
ncbi:MAG: hypothetical protein BalsKO_06450 [Balneolaceae bacterium]